MEFLPRASYRSYCPTKDFATWKAAICQDLVIIMVITRADWSRYWWQWAASEFLSLGLRHRDLQNNGWGFSQVGAVGTMEAFRPGKEFFYSINYLWIRERTIWINFTINLKGAPLFQGRGTETRPWKAMKIEFHLDKPRLYLSCTGSDIWLNLQHLWNRKVRVQLCKVPRAAGSGGKRVVLNCENLRNTWRKTWGFRMLGRYTLNQERKSQNT